MEELAVKIADAIQSDNVFSKERSVPKITAVLKAWVRIFDRPMNYDKIKTDKGILVRTIEKKDVELKYWKEQIRRLQTQDQMQIHYGNLKGELIQQGFQDFFKEVATSSKGDKQ